MDTKKLILDIIEELDEYGKWKGILMGDGENYENYISVSIAKMIVRKNAEKIRYKWN